MDTPESDGRAAVTLQGQTCTPASFGASVLRCAEGRWKSNADWDNKLDLLEEAGFAAVVVPGRSRIEIPDEALPEGLSDCERAAFAEGGLWSFIVQEMKPAQAWKGG